MITIGRFKAFAFHLVGSAAAVAACAFLIYGIWYPGPTSVLTGVTGIFLILMSVDAVIGPLLTLVVFDARKKELKRDLAIVLLLQVGALIYGMHALYIARPVYIVFAVDRFELVYANDLTDEKLAKVTDPLYKELPILGPKIIAVRRPPAGKERNDIVISSIQGGDDVPQLPQYYVALSAQVTELRARLLPVEQLHQFNPDQRAKVIELIDRAQKIGPVGFLPVRGKVADAAAVVLRSSGEVLEVVQLKPWH